MGVFIDHFEKDAGWGKVGSYVDSTYNITGGIDTLTAGAGGVDTSAWCRTGFEGWNASITANITNIASTPQIHLRESSQGNYLKVYLDYATGTLNIGKVVGGTYTSLGSIACGINNAGTYTFTAKVFGDCLFAAILSAASPFNVYKQLYYIGSDISAFTGIFGGIGLTVNTQKFNWVDMRTLTRLTNVVCVGDSNVGSDNAAYWPNQMLKRRFNEGFISFNEGTGGYSTQDIYDERATRIAPYFIAGADNVVSIATGNNDYAVESKTAAQAYAVQQTLMTYCKSLGYRCELATLIPFPYTQGARPTTSLVFVDDLNTLIRAGASVDGFTLCEIHNAFGATDGQLGVNPLDVSDTSKSLVNADQIHYTTTLGHPLAAKTHLFTLNKNSRTSI